jgi:uncharacterized protein
LGMVNLTFNEARVLGTLIEKAQTVPAQYPITLNSLVLGCNQKNNREPVTNLSEDDVLDALDGLRGKKLAAEVMLSGSRVSKYRHLAREGLAVSTAQLVILAELLLRGPQSLGELRGRASRMHPLESLEAVQEILNSLMRRGEGEGAEAGEPLVRSVAPAPGSRAMRFAQLLAPDIHPLDAPAAGAAGAGRGGDGPGIDGDTADPALAARVDELERQVESLRSELQALRERTGF